jgi:dTDP-4-dehydrorhamnose reductase
VTRVLLLGAGGMLGSAAAGVLAGDPEIEVTAPARSAFDAEHDDVGVLLDDARPHWVVNTIAVLASLIDERDAESVRRATAVNALFPAALAEAASDRGVCVLQSSTDGVFSGTGGPYDEAAPADATDVYGATKRLGEVTADGVVHLRCSVLGLEPCGQARSLVGRLMARERGARLTGFTDHRWNGVTAQAWARVCRAIVREPEPLPSPFHLVPADSVSKYDLLRLVAAAVGRDDLEIEPGTGPAPNDRTLKTRHPEYQQRLWAAAGYDRAPAIAEMVTQMAAQ